MVARSKRALCGVELISPNTAVQQTINAFVTIDASVILGHVRLPVGLDEHGYQPRPRAYYAAPVAAAHCQAGDTP
jgi:hypothetical protein